jgi:hypothetical protein
VITNSKFLNVIGAIFFGAFTAGAQAVPVDLSTWTAEGGGGSWLVQAGGDAVLQQVNTTTPTVFYDGNTLSQGQALNGNITVQTTSDDDFIGFVLGYTAAGGIGDAVTDFFLVDWKQGNQVNAGVLGEAGIAISHVTNGLATFDDFWSHNSAAGVTEIAEGNNLGSTGWADNTAYAFNILFTDQLIQVSVNNILELSIDPNDVAGISSFSDGSFGFYNMSQQSVLYSSITQVDCNQTPSAPECHQADVPEPGTLALLCLGLLGTVAARTRVK